MATTPQSTQLPATTTSDSIVATTYKGNTSPASVPCDTDCIIAIASVTVVVMDLLS